MKYFVSLVVAWAVLGCATTRVVKTQHGRGGEIAVHDGIFGDARAEAKEKMRENCGNKKPVVYEEGEAVVGSRVSADSNRTKFGTLVTGDVEDKREWRLKYKCGGKAAE